jgi:hypothetical protein
MSGINLTPEPGDELVHKIVQVKRSFIYVF